MPTSFNNLLFDYTSNNLTMSLTPVSLIVNDFFVHKSNEKVKASPSVTNIGLVYFANCVIITK